MLKYDNVLYIIGNGFDLFHGLKSSYYDFRDYIKKTNWDLFQRLEVYHTDYLWNDFERKLGQFNSNLLFEASSIFLPDIKEDFEDLQMSQIYLAGDFAAGESYEMLSELKKSLKKWAETLCNNKIEALLGLDDYAHYLSFNYTNLLSKVYGIENERINQIHGRCMGYKDELIIGHSIDEDLSTNEHSRNRFHPKRKQRYNFEAVENLHEKIGEHFSDSSKKSSEIIRANSSYFQSLNDVEYIYILGHSISDVDACYYEKIIEVNNNPDKINWIIAFRKEEDKITLKDNIQNLGIPSNQVTFKFWEEFVVNRK